MKLHTVNPNIPRTAVVRLVAAMVGQKVDVNVVDDAFTKSAEWKKLAITNTFPLLETKEGGLQEPNAICKYLCHLAGGKLLGGSALERSHCD